MYQLMVVDDAQAVRQELSKIDWPSVGVQLVKVCEHGLEALRYIQGQGQDREPGDPGVDIVITDVDMPVMSGIELMAKLKDCYPQVQVIALSGHADFHYAQQSIKNGAKDYLLKPLHSPECKSAVAKLVAELDEQRRKNAHLNKSESRKKTLTAILRRQFLEDLLHQPMPAEEIYDNAAYAEMMIEEDEAFTVAIYRLDGLENKSVAYTEQEWDLIAFALDNVLGEFLEQTGLGYHWLDKKACWVYLLVTGDCQQSSPQDAEAAILQVRDCLYRVKSLFHTTLSVAVGGTKNIVTQILPSANEARLTLPHLPPASVLFYRPEYGAGSAAVSKDSPEPQVYCEDVTAETGKYIIDKAIHFIKNNYTTSITLEDVSKEVFVNPAYFSYLFKQATGINFICYLTNLRIGKAKEMLKDPRYKIQDISEAVGYENYRYFSQLFKKHVGKTPFEYRSYV